MQPSHSSQDVPGLEGPDYVALVIEWNDDDDVATLVTGEFTAEPPRSTGTVRTIAAVLGALGALMLAVWGIRRLRTA
ncbi:MAG TPA: hypothetical protein VK607_24420 [Kofleriaceae bacterium]|nr:hypothetical protein [Kofleriaceae bacterium]